MDEQGPCRRRTAFTDGYAERDEEMIRANRRVRVNETADTMAISTVMCIQFFHRELQFRKFCSRWVLRELTTEHKKKRVDCAPGYWNFVKRKERRFGMYGNRR